MRPRSTTPTARSGEAVRGAPADVVGLEAATDLEPDLPLASGT